MTNRALSTRGSSTLSVVFATLFFLFVGLTLSAIMAHVVGTMVGSADAIDNARARHAAQSVLSSLKDKIAAVTADNSVWDDAYAASLGSDPVGWAYSNWAKTSVDYALYDGVLVIDQDRKTYSSYFKGQPFDAAAMFGPALADQTALAAQGGRTPLVHVLKSDGRIFLVSSNAIQPFDATTDTARHHVLTFFKELTPAVLAEEAEEHDLPGLRLTTAPVEGELSLPLGLDLGSLAWAAKHPGHDIYRVVEPFIYVALTILLVFLLGILACGTVEARRLKRLASAAQYEAAHDGLTGLFNRTGLLQDISRLQNLGLSDGELTLHLVDLDGFKAVNDAWGHAVGDALIKQVAEAFSSLRPQVEAVARLGGDEFALVQSGALSAEVDAAILDIFRVPFVIAGRTIEVGASIGTASAIATVDPLEILRRADMALYRAKEDGRGRVVHYDPTLDVEREHLSLLEHQLREAIAQGEIQPVFQPLVSAIDGTIRGVEALARWEGPSGRISPDVFIPLAEKSGQIDALGRHMLLTSIAFAKGWPDLYLSVNVSPLQLCNPDFSFMVLGLLSAEGFDPKRLTLEITEGVLMSNPDQARRSIEGLKKVGVKFALDDFGCGYASIGALRAFGFDRVKIDRSLVTALEEKANGRDVLTATVLLATALDIPVTAEGIEHPTQAEILREAGCDQFQGYLMGKPMPGSEIDRLLQLGQPLGPSHSARTAAVA